MSLKALYQQFLARPTSAPLTEGASLNYITTLTTISEPDLILKHIAREEKQLKKKEEKILDAIEAQDAVFLEVETTIEFLTSGGAYLPGLDDNFLADSIVTFPITHVVHFDPSRKIQQIRLTWDQGSLLKMVDVIGSRARTWPIRDGKEQAWLIASRVASIANANGFASQGARPAGVSKDSNEATNTGRGHSNSAGSKNVTRDPHASLSLFAAREENEDPSYPTAIAPRASAKPPPRDYHDLFVGNDENFKAPTVGKHSSETPVAHKGGAGKNFKPSRLFETEASQPGTPGTPQESPNKFYKPHPTKYNHFDFGDGSDEPQRIPDASPTRSINTKHQSQWDFKDFTTPEQRRTKVRGQDVRHFGFSDEEVEHAESPVKQPKQVPARPDTKAQIELQDDGEPAGDRRAGPSRGAGQNKGGMGLYQMNLYDDDSLVSSANKGEQQNKPLSNVTNMNNHRKDIDSQTFEPDQSPSSKTNVNNENKPVGGNTQKPVKMMGSDWDAYDQSPRQAHVKKENMGRNSTNSGIKTGGDGMGGKKGASRNWGIGDDSDDEAAGGKGREKFQAAKKQQAPAENNFWDY
ncbi:MAG: hypothetical protein M1812_001543 [Candelaria pacifica]|nr:MAG: hypothetical protein M1812_001543 [Candelaria pacifica]